MIQKPATIGAWGWQANHFRELVDQEDKLTNIHKQVLISPYKTRLAIIVKRQDLPHVVDALKEILKKDL